MVLGCDFEDAQFVSDVAGLTVPATVDVMQRIRDAIADMPGVPSPGTLLLHDGGVWIPFFSRDLVGVKSPEACFDELRGFEARVAKAVSALEMNSKMAEPRPFPDVVDCPSLRTVIEEMALAKAKVWRLEARQKVKLPVAEVAWLVTRKRTDPEEKTILAEIRGVFLINGTLNCVLVQARMFILVPVGEAQARAVMAERNYIHGVAVWSKDGWRIDPEREWGILTQEQFKERQKKRRAICT